MEAGCTSAVAPSSGRPGRWPRREHSLSAASPPPASARRSRRRNQAVRPGGHGRLDRDAHPGGPGTALLPGSVRTQLPGGPGCVRVRLPRHHRGRSQRQDYLNQAQNSAPILFFDVGDDAYITLYNLGLLNRPDLSDSHTVHWHGFPNQIPYFDGVPRQLVVGARGQLTSTTGSSPTCPARTCTTATSRTWNTSRWACRARSSCGRRGTPSGRTTTPRPQFDRQFCLHLNEVFLRGHYGDAHLQDTDWTEFQANFYLMNGRSYPDTIAPGTATRSPNATGPLQFQPISALVEATPASASCCACRTSGYQEHAFELPGSRAAHGRRRLQVPRRRSSGLLRERGREATSRRAATRSCLAPARAAT